MYSGDISKGCASAGPHFNPYNRTHGAPSDSERHVYIYIYNYHISSNGIPLPNIYIL